MNSIETSTETSKRRIETTTSQIQQISNNSVLARDQIFFGDKTMIKYVIGASNNTEQQSILKKPPTNQISSGTLLSSNVKAKVRPDAVDTTQQKTLVSLQSECSQQLVNTNASQSLIKLPILQEETLDKTDSKTLKKSSSSLQQTQMPAPKPLGHVIYNAKNGQSRSSYNEIFTSSLCSGYKNPSNLQECQPMAGNLIRNRQNSLSDISHISSSVTLTKAAGTGKQPKSPPSPLITIVKRSSPTNLKSNDKNIKNADIINAINNDKGIDVTTTETGQKSLLLKQSSPPATKEKTPPKLITRHRQQSLLKVNSLARLLHTSPRTKRSKSLTAISRKNRKIIPREKCTSLAASDGEVTDKKSNDKLPTSEPITKQKTKEEAAPVTVNKPDCASLLCNDKVETVPSSSSNSSFEQPTHSESKTLNAAEPIVNSFHFNSVLEMLSAFSMLSWKERIGSCRDSSMQFRLNEFNLLQIAEKCPPREQIHIPYEKTISTRETSSKSSDKSDQYFCRKCGCNGVSIDFLAPGYCSYECFRGDSKKRSKINFFNLEKIVRNRFKKYRKSENDEVIGFQKEIDLTTDVGTNSKRYFTWSTYLIKNDAKPAPVDLFLNPFPCGSNQFEVGMKLEAIDPEHNSLFCVCTIVEKKGYRLQLKFDGYPRMYNFWVNADSMDIFPPGWCAKTNRTLQPPKGMSCVQFNWPNYLNVTKSHPAPRSLFTHLNSSSTANPFKAGMRLEADDLKNTGKVCVASVADVLANRILIHFDGWDECYDYWIDINSPYIHPIGWHEKNGLDLVPPPDWEESFSWPEYLVFIRSEAAPSKIFSCREAIDFKPGMKLEVVDIKNACLIRPATVVCHNEYKLLLHLDGWPEELTFWVNDDSPDIHPITWANVTGHFLEPPPGFELPAARMNCPIKGCRGIGNAKIHDIAFHSSESACPYNIKNWQFDVEKPVRVEEPKRHPKDEKPKDKLMENNDKNVIDISSDEESKEDIDSDYEARLPRRKRLHVSDNKHTIDDKAVISYRKKLRLSDSKPIVEQNTSFDKEIKIAREYLCDYGPRLKQNYKIWVENSNFKPGIIRKNPLEWTTEETADYISKTCYPIGYLFQREDIDGEALLSMRQSDLTDILKLKLGPSIKIFSHILHLRNHVFSRFIKT